MLPWTRPTRSGAPASTSALVSSADCPTPHATSTAAVTPTVSDRPARARDDDVAQRGADERDERRQTVDAEDARQLRDRQHRDLAVAEQHPRKSAPEVAARRARSPPRPRARARRAPAEPAPSQPRHSANKQETARGRRRAARRPTRRPASPARRTADDRAGPVDRADEIARAGCQPEPERAIPAERLAASWRSNSSMISGANATHAKTRMAEAREAEGEKNAGEKRANQGWVTCGRCCVPEAIRTRHRRRAPQNEIACALSQPISASRLRVF